MQEERDKPRLSLKDGSGDADGLGELEVPRFLEIARGVGGSGS
jgi:hypothetical protein